ncbi:MAG: ORF6N domain-containing protein [Candidatus Omnitrophica bacterium]|nr:ORF6N domain-containing protein [Candidatus Omnitrophota bacterium]
MANLLYPEAIELKIFLIRGQRVILDADLARIFNVKTFRLNEAVKRNIDRFPEDFVFRLTEEEKAEVIANCDHLKYSGEIGALRSQFAISKKGRGGSRYLPYAFTEHGALMAANVLNSPVAVKASVQVVRAFVNLRKMLLNHKELARKIAELEGKYDVQFKIVFDAIRKLMNPAKPKHRRKIGFHLD